MNEHVRSSANAAQHELIIPHPAKITAKFPLQLKGTSVPCWESWNHPRAALFDNLESYARFFPAEQLAIVYSGGNVTFGSQGYQLLDLLELIGDLDSMAGCEGFEELIAGFRNAPQFRSTIYEAKMAKWCLSRAMTRSLRFGPVVPTNRGPKKPAFLWETSFGSPYVECKQASAHENSIQKRLHRLFAVATAEYANHPLDDATLRLDLSVGSRIANGVEGRVRTAVGKLCRAGVSDQVVEVGEIRGVVNSRLVLFPPEAETVRVFQITVGTVPTKLDAENAHITMGLGMGRFREQLVARLVREARQQLPDDGIGVVFIDLGATQAVADKLKSLMGSSAYQRTPWICLSVGQVPVQAMWQNGQPLDGRLWQ
jgi:hypothetical protein